MRKLLISLLALTALAACSSGGNDSTTREAAQAPVETANPIAETTETTAAGVQTGDIEVAGTVGCGHCTYSIGEECSAAVRTADGAIYILEGVGDGDELFFVLRGNATVESSFGAITAVHPGRLGVRGPPASDLQ